jgi:hypothetical protein
MIARRLALHTDHIQELLHLGRRERLLTCRRAAEAAKAAASTARSLGSWQSRLSRRLPCWAGAGPAHLLPHWRCSLLLLLRRLLLLLGGGKEGGAVVQNRRRRHRWRLQHGAAPWL